MRKTCATRHPEARVARRIADEIRATLTPPERALLARVRASDPDAMPGITRKFNSFSAALEEVKNARVVGGIHFRTACVDGQALGISVADYVITHVLVPLGGGLGGQDQ